MVSKAKESLNILFLTSEAVPFAKVGGLGDYSGSLPSAVKSLGQRKGIPVDIRVALPFHQTISIDRTQLSKVTDLEVPTKKGAAKGSAFSYERDRIPYYLIKRSGRAGGYKNVYSLAQTQDARKYVFFSLASLELIKSLGWRPDIIHANDWHTAIAVHRLRQLQKSDPFFEDMRSLLVIHNLPYMGEGAQSVLTEFAIPPLKAANLPAWSKHLPLVMGVESADRIVAVSPTYAQELQQEEFSNGLKGLFIEKESHTRGILNGIDPKIWDPEADANLPFHFSASSLVEKKKNKAKILNDMGLEDRGSKPLLVIISRLDVQKGIDLVLVGLPKMLDLDWNLIVLGTGDKEYEAAFKTLQQQNPERIRTFLEFNSHLAHQLYAAGDILLMPSRYEPCGISQMIAMRYGCVPVARAVGGLRDTIDAENEISRTGYLFEEESVPAFMHTLQQAMHDFYNEEKWTSIQTRGMRKDFSWKNSAEKYFELYLELVEEKEKRKEGIL